MDLHVKDCCLSYKKIKQDSVECSRREESLAAISSSEGVISIEMLQISKQSAFIENIVEEFKSFHRPDEFQAALLNHKNICDSLLSVQRARVCALHESIINKEVGFVRSISDFDDCLASLSCILHENLWSIRVELLVELGLINQELEEERSKFRNECLSNIRFLLQRRLEYEKNDCLSALIQTEQMCVNNAMHVERVVFNERVDKLECNKKHFNLLEIDLERLLDGGIVFKERLRRNLFQTNFGNTERVMLDNKLKQKLIGLHSVRLRLLNERNSRFF